MNAYGGIKSALDTKTPEGIQVAKDQADQRIAALTNSNSAADKVELSGLQGIRKMMDANPSIASGWIGTGMYSTPEGQKYIDSQYKDKGQPSEINLRDAQAALAWANALKAEREAKAGKPLTTKAEETLNAAGDQAVKAYSMADQYKGIADRFKSYSGNSGLLAQGAEEWKKIWGSQDQITLLKTDFDRIRTSGVLDMLPPGSASDRDIQIAQGAFPDKNANPAVIAQFMDTLSRLKTYEGDIAKAKGQWISKNGNMGTALEGFKVNGIEVKPDTDFTDFVRKNLAVSSGSGKASGQPVAAPANPPSGKAPASAPAQAPAKSAFDTSAMTITKPDGTVLRYKDKTAFDADMKKLQSKGVQ